MAGMVFDITGDNSNFLKRLEEARNGVRSTAKQIEESGMSIEQMFGRLAKGAADFGVGFSAQQFASQVMKVRGEFQQLEVAFNTMLGSEEKANTLMQQLVKTAATTPFDLQSVAGGAKQLLAYGVSAENVNGTLIRLGDIAAGLSIPLGDLVYLYGTTMSQGRLYTQDLNQFTGRGIPMIGELAKQFGVAESEVKKLVESGKVGFPEVQKVIESLTNEGGKFGGLMEAQSKTITGQISNIEDSISTMYNNIGKQSEGFINDALSGVSYLVENYEDIGKIILELVGTYGAYRTTLMVTTALQALQASGIAALTVKEAVHYGWLVLTKKAQDALNLSMLKNPFVLAAVAVVGLAYGIYKLATAETDAEEAIRTTNEALEAQKKHYDDLKSKVSELSGVLTSESKSIEERFIAYRQLQRLMPSVFKDMDFETAKRLSNIDAIKLETDEILRQQRIGLKTKVVMSEQKIQGLRNSIIKTDNKGGYTGALKEDLDAAQKELEIYQKALKDFEDAKKESDKSKSKPIVRNKSFWDTQKKYAETALDAIDSKQRKLLNAGKFDKVDSKVVANYKEQKRLIAEAEKELKAYPSASDSTKQDKSSDTLRKEQEKLALLMDKQALDQSRSAADLQTQVDQARINAMDEGSKKTLAQMELNFEKEMQAIDRQKEDLLRKKVEDERAKFDKKEDENAAKDPKYKKQTFNPTGIVLSDGENKQFDSLYKAPIESFEKDKQRQELEAMRDYLKEYGTFQQQKLAIAEEYAEKIKNAQNKGEVLKLEKERDTTIQNKETEAIKANIDWVTIFGEFGGMFNDMIKPALEEAKKYVQTDKFKNSDQASQKALIDAINQMEKSLGGAGGVNFKKLGQDVQVYQNALRSLSTAKEEEVEAINKLKKANEDYEKAVKNGTKEELQAAKDAQDIAQQNADTASANVKTQTNITNQSQQDVTNTATGLRASMVNVTEGLNKLASGGIKNAYDGLIQAGKGIGGSMEKITKSLDNVPIIGWILSIIDVFKDGLSNFVGPLLDSIFNAISGILSDVLSGDFFVTIGKSLASGVGNILNAISFGGFNTLMGKISGSNAKEVQEAIDKLTDRNEILGKSIDKLTDVMEKEAGSKAISAYEQAKKYQQETNDNTLQIAREQARYSGSHHSWQKYMEWTPEQIQWAQKNVDSNFSGTDSLWGLSPEQMKLLLSNADIYNQITSEGKGGYGGRVMEKLEAYADQAGKLDALTEKINESIAQISFDSLRDSFVDTLMDMDSSAEDFANDFEEYLMRAMLNFSMEDIDAEMKAWYNNWAETIGKQGGTLTEDQIKQYKKEWDSYVQRGIDKRNGLAELTGYEGSDSSDREASKKGFASMSQDSADELNGRFTVIQGHTYEINGSVKAIQSDTAKIAEKLSFLTNMDKNMSDMVRGNDVIVAHLSNIEGYTENLVDIRQFMYSMKLGIDTLNTKGITLKR